MRGARLWVLAANDGEAVEIERLLADRGEGVLISRQPWGARWADLEPAIQDAVDRFRGLQPEAEVIGVELAGANRWRARNIDHHVYPDEDRSHPESAIEQVARELGVELNRWQRLVAANDRGYIPAMEALDATPEEIAAVRRQDRQAQGLTPEDEDRARRDIESAEWRGDRVLVRCCGQPTSAHSDFLHGQAKEALLIGNRSWEYEGPRRRLFAAQGFTEETWMGGAEASGYFGVKSPGPESQRRLLELFWTDLSTGAKNV